LRVENLRARVADQPIQGEAEVVGAEDPTVRFALTGKLDLAAVSRMIGPADMHFTGAADVDLRGRGRAKDAGAMDLDGRVVLAGVRVETPERTLENVKGALTFSKQRATARGLEARSGASSFALEATVTRPLALTAEPGTTSPADVDFTLRSPYLDLAELMPATPGSPLLPNARGTGQISVARLKNEGLDVRDVSARIRLEPGVVTADPFLASAYGGVARGALAADFSRSDAPKITVRAQLDSARVDSLLTTWTGAGGLLKGTLVTHLDITAAGVSPEDIQRSLAGEGELLVLNGVLGPAPVLSKVASLTRMPSLETLRFRDARSPFRIENGRVLTGPAALHGNFGDAVLAGAVGFDGSLDYVASLTIPKSLVARMGAEAALAAGALSDDEGNVLLDLRIGGSAQKPNVSLDQKAMADRLTGKAMKLIQRQGQGFEKKLFDALGIAPASGDSAGSDSARRDTTQVTDGQRRQLEKQLKSKAQDLLRGFFGDAPDTTKK